MILVGCLVDSNIHKRLASLNLPQAPYANASSGFVHAMHCGFWGSWIFSIADATSSANSSTTIEFDEGGWQVNKK